MNLFMIIISLSLVVISQYTNSSVYAFSVTGNSDKPGNWDDLGTRDLLGAEYRIQLDETTWPGIIWCLIRFNVEIGIFYFVVYLLNSKVDQYADKNTRVWFIILEPYLREDCENNFAVKLKGGTCCKGSAFISGISSERISLML